MRYLDGKLRFLVIVIVMVYMMLLQMACDTVNPTETIVKDTVHIDTVKNPMLVQIVPESKTIRYYESLNIQVAAVGTSLTYHWKVNNEPDTETTTNCFTFHSDSVGVYYITVWAESEYGYSNPMHSKIIVE